MRIAYFTESLPPNTDGVVRTLSKLTEALDRHGIDYRFYSPFKPDESFTWAARVHKLVSVPVALYPDYRVSIPYLHPLVAQLDRFRPDLVHVVSPTPLGLFALDYATRRKIPAVSSYHTHFVSYLPYYGLEAVANLLWKFLRWFHNRCSRTYAPSPSTLHELVRRGIRHVELWQRGVDLTRFSPQHRSESLRQDLSPEGYPVVLYVGRLVREKDLGDLAQAVKLLDEWGVKFRLALVGDGPMRAELEKAIPQACFAGYQHGEALARWFASADVFAFPSTTETFGNVVLEAFASGLPVVGVRSGGVMDLVTPHRDGFLVAPHDPEAFAQALRVLLEDGELRRTMGHRALAKAASYRWEVVNSRLIQSYQEVVGTAREAA